MKGTITTMRNSLLLIVTVATLLVIFGAPTSFATGISLDVSINTSGLPISPGSEIFFILTDGSGTGDANNTATMTTFALGGGSVGAVDLANTFGGASGGISSTVSLTDSSFTNVFAETFSAGSSLSFLLNLTTNVDAGGTPDQFSISIVNPSGSFLSPSDPLTGNLLAINLDSASPSVSTFSSLVNVSTPGPVNTPEPATILLLAAGLAAIALSTKRRTTPS
jgi:hypothetical protein